MKVKNREYHHNEVSCRANLVAMAVLYLVAKIPQAEA